MSITDFLKFSEKTDIALTDSELGLSVHYNATVGGKSTAEAAEH